MAGGGLKLPMIFGVGMVLTDLERQVLLLVASGLRNDEIARRLSVDERDMQKIVTELLGRLSTRPPHSPAA